MKKLLSIVLALMMAVSCLAGISAVAFAAEPPQNGWYQETISYELENGTYDSMKIWFYYQNGSYVTGWRYINKKWYFFDEDGWMFQDQGYWDDEDNLYFFNKSGAMVTGWYCFKDEYDDGDGNISPIEEWYYLQPNGKAAKGWQKLGGKWYYFDEEYYNMYAENVAPINGKWYLFAKSGAMMTGWQKVGGYWYYFKSSGECAKGWCKVGGKWYYFAPGEDGDIMSMSIGWEKIGSKWYYFNSSGAMVTGWLKSGGKWYYLNSDGSMVTGSKKIGKKTYKFNSSGVCTNP